MRVEILQYFRSYLYESVCIYKNISKKTLEMITNKKKQVITPYYFKVIVMRTSDILGNNQTHFVNKGQVFQEKEHLNYINTY